MEKQFSKWAICSNGHLTHDGTLPIPVRIIYLDDHRIFRKAIVDYCIRPFFEDVEITEFLDGDKAWQFIKEEIKDNQKIDLIITDINHPGMRGNELAKKIRRQEKLSRSSTRIPIIVISMVAPENYPELTIDKVVNYYLQKSTEGEDIVECLEEILYTH